MSSMMKATIVGLGICLATALHAQMRVGAAKVDMTPASGAIPEGYNSIHDQLYTRAIYIESKGKRAVLMNVDVGTVPADLWKKFTTEISSKYGVPTENILASAAHIHSSLADMSGRKPGSSEPTPKVKVFIDRTYAAMLESVKEAKDAAVPAEMGYGEGALYLNVNRDGIDPKTRFWTQGPNLEAPSDKTLAILEFRKANGGEPIAVYMNYAMHAVSMFLRGDMSGDFPESASQYVEDAFDNKAVVVWSMAAAGDQNPLYLRPVLEISEARIHNEMDNSKPDDAGGTEYGAALMRLFFGAAVRADKPADPKLMKESWRVVEAMGTFMGEETLRVMSSITYYESSPVIQGDTAEIACPGRKAIDHPRQGVQGHYEDAPDVHISIGALRIGDVALGHVYGEPYNKIGQEIKQFSPFKKTMVVGLAAGQSNGGYIPSDDAFGHNTFQVLGNRLKPGCAEMSIVNGIDGLLENDLKASAEK